jgi:hypothetical protein
MEHGSNVLGEVSYNLDGLTQVTVTRGSKDTFWNIQCIAGKALTSI